MSGPERQQVIGHRVGLACLAIFLGATVYAIVVELPQQQSGFYAAIERRLEASHREEVLRWDAERETVRRERKRDVNGVLLISRSIDNHSKMMEKMQGELIKTLRALEPKDDKAKDDWGP